MMQIKQMPDTANVRVVSVGDVDVDTVEGFRQRLFDVVTQNTINVILDAAQLNYVNSGGLAVLVELDTKLMRAGGRLKILKPTTTLRRLLKETRLDKILLIADEDEATAAPDT